MSTHTHTRTSTHIWRRHAPTHIPERHSEWASVVACSTDICHNYRATYNKHTQPAYGWCPSSSVCTSYAVVYILFGHQAFTSKGQHFLSAFSFAISLYLLLSVRFISHSMCIYLYFSVSVCNLFCCYCFFFWFYPFKEQLGKMKIMKNGTDFYINKTQAAAATTTKANENKTQWNPKRRTALQIPLMVLFMFDSSSFPSSCFAKEITVEGE